MSNVYDGILVDAVRVRDEPAGPAILGPLHAPGHSLYLSMFLPCKSLSEGLDRVRFQFWRIFRRLLRGILRFKFGRFCHLLIAYVGFSLILKEFNMDRNFTNSHT